MLRKDYIQRLFEEFGKFLSTLLAKKMSGDYETFEKEIAEAVQKYTELELKDLENLSEGEFTEKINSTGLEFDQKKILANLVFEKMNYFLEIGDDKNYKNLKVKSRMLYEIITSDLTLKEFDLEAHYRLDLLKKQD